MIKSSNMNTNNLTIELLDSTFEELFWSYDDSSAHNDLLPLDNIKKILVKNGIPFKETDDFFEDKTWGLLTPYGFIYQRRFSPNQIYSFSHADWLSVAIDMTKGKFNID